MAYLLKVMSRGPQAYTFRRGIASAPLVYSEEVQMAKATGQPIVALESTIITHGMPYPSNLQTAIQVEDIIRRRGAIPATIAILKGQLTVGLTKEQLEYLAQIGGVHREGETTLDISADLNELGRNRTLVVCSGVKSILDIGRTLEYLETQGVCVCSFGDSDDFPAFYTRKSGYKAPHRVNDALHAARLLQASQELQLSSGIVIAVPLPEEHAMDENVIAGAIKIALEKGAERGIKGKEVTPFILAAVTKATDGASLKANIALIKSNAKVGADIAVELKKLRIARDSEKSFNIGVSKSGKLSPDSRKSFHTSCIARNKEEGKFNNDFPMFANKNLDGDVLVIGGANVDRTYRVMEPRVQMTVLADTAPLPSRHK
ncbi:uncharacterized protein LOC113233389 [Hyposmocoma kahamanoa]|uniref:uncharacterized protein LOC113233389 n=1 Tax=Hyposmocoma kahamanoa TaxID=1477025 RepID=UPI000E6D7AA8|nr:uncharacterized protein LOC113233389 [Hyposmocoma kahamanoa]